MALRGLSATEAARVSVIVTAEILDLQRKMREAAASMEGAKANSNSLSKSLSSLQSIAAKFGVVIGTAVVARAIRDFAAESIQAAQRLENFRNALNAALPEGQSYVEFITKAREETRGMLSEWEMASAATSLFAGGLAKTTEEAAKLVAAGQILVPIFEANGASMEKFVRLLASGNRVLLDNFGLTMEMLNARKAEIEATTDLSSEEARLQATRDILLAQADKFRTSIGESTVASYQLHAAVTDLKSALGQELAPAVITTSTVLAGYAKHLIAVREETRLLAEGNVRASQTNEEFAITTAKAGKGLEIDLSGAYFETAKAAQQASEIIKASMLSIGPTIDENIKQVQALYGTWRWFVDESGEWQKELVSDTEKWAETDQEAVKWSQYHRYAYYEALGDFYTDDLKKQEEHRKEERKLMEEADEERRQNVMAIASNFVSLDELRRNALESERAYQENLNSVREDAAERYAENEAQLNERLESLAEQRRDKLVSIQRSMSREVQSELEQQQNAWIGYYEKQKDLAGDKFEESTSVLRGKLDEREGVQREYQEKLLELEKKQAEEGGPEYYWEQQRATLKAHYDEELSEYQFYVDKFNEMQTEQQNEVAGIEEELQAKLLQIRNDYEAIRRERLRAEEERINEHYANQEAIARESYNKQNANIAQALAEREATLETSRQKELAKEQAAFDEMNMKAALAMLELQGTLETFFGTAVKNSDEAALLIQSGLIRVSREAQIAIQRAMDKLRSARSEIFRRNDGRSNRRGGPQAQHGLDMTIPPGFNQDNFPVWVSSGERVQVTPRDEVNRVLAVTTMGRGGNTYGGNAQVTQNFYITLQGVQSPTVLFEAIQREAKARGKDLVRLN